MNEGVSLQKIREASERLASHDQDLASACLYTDGDHLYYFQPRTQMFVDLTRHPDQLGLKALFPVQDTTKKAARAFEKKEIA